jgi:hypothetical protein
MKQWRSKLLNDLDIYGAMWCAVYVCIENRARCLCLCFDMYSVLYKYKYIKAQLHVRTCLTNVHITRVACRVHAFPRPRAPRYDIDIVGFNCQLMHTLHAHVHVHVYCRLYFTAAKN